MPQRANGDCAVGRPVGALSSYRTRGLAAGVGEKVSTTHPTGIEKTWGCPPKV